MLTTDQFQRSFKGQSSIAKKVYDATPISEQWTSAQICKELMRKGHNIERKTIDGCLQAMKSDGLIQEPERGVFKRVRVKSKTEQEADHVEYFAPPPKKESTMQKEPQKPDSVATLGELADRARSLSGDLKTLADDIEKSAIEFEAEHSESAEEIQKLRQLKDIINSFGGK